LGKIIIQKWLDHWGPKVDRACIPAEEKKIPRGGYDIGGGNVSGQVGLPGKCPKGKGPILVCGLEERGVKFIMINRD